VFIASIAAALESTRLASVIRTSSWIFPATETVHVIAISLVVGSIVVLDLRLLGLSWNRRPITEIAQDVLPRTWMSFIIAVASGSMMFISAASKYVVDTPFQLKMVLLLLAGANMAVFHLFTYPGVARWNHTDRTPAAARIAAALSIVFWVTIIACGRMVSFTTQEALF
jgi:hypothetical protein